MHGQTHIKFSTSSQAYQASYSTGTYTFFPGIKPAWFWT